MKTRHPYSLIISGIALLILSIGSCLQEPLSAENIEPQPLTADSISGQKYMDPLVMLPSAEQSTATEEIEQEPEPDLEFANAASARAYMRHSADSDKYAAGILPQMAGESLNYTTKLLNSKYDKFIIVDKGRMKVVLYDRYGRELKSYGMACAVNYGTKHKRSDMRTPEGFFSVKRIQNSTDWLYTDDNGVTSPKKGQYGPRFIRLDTPVTGSIGIHGTCAPWSIGGRRSHGCIRIKNEDILELAELVEPGMPVIVSPGKRDMAVNLQEGVTVEHVSTLLKNSTHENDMAARTM